MKGLLALVILTFFLPACSMIATSGAEVTGLSLWHDRRSGETLIRDERIEINAEILLNAETEIRRQCHFNITAYNGIVLVTGEAPNTSLSDKIISIVRQIPDVKLVHNQLSIAQPTSLTSRSYDALITTRVKTALSQIKNLPGFDATRIKVITEQAVVYLMGLVHYSEANIAAEVARRETGVRQVVKVFELIE